MAVLSAGTPAEWNEVTNIKKLPVTEISHEHVHTPDGLRSVRIVRTRYVEVED